MIEDWARKVSDNVNMWWSWLDWAPNLYDIRIILKSCTLRLKGYEMNSAHKSFKWIGDAIMKIKRNGVL